MDNNMMDILNISDPGNFKDLIGLNEPSPLEINSGIYMKKAETRYIAETYTKSRDMAPCWGWFAVLDGDAVAIVGDDTKSMGICSCALVPGGFPTSIKPTNGKTLITCLTFTGPQVETLVANVKMEQNKVTFGSYNNRLIRSSVAISKILHERPLNFSYLIHAALWRFFGYLPEMVYNMPANIPSGISAVIQYISDNMHINPSIDEMALISNMGRETFRKQFTGVMGMSPIKYLLKKKITHSKELMADSRLTIKAIGLAMGFEDPYYFSRVFKKFEGMSPNMFRKGFYPEYSR